MSLWRSWSGAAPHPPTCECSLKREKSDVFMQQESEKPRVQSVARAAAIIMAVARCEGRAIPAKDVAEQLKLPRQVVYHLTHTLSQCGLLRKSGTEGYVLGLSVASIAEGFRRQMSGPDLLGEYVEDVARSTGETAYVSGWVEGDVVVRATARGELPIQARAVPIGISGGGHCRASGKLLLSMLPPEEITAYVRRNPMRQMTPNTITTLAALKVELESIRKQWVSIDREEFAEGLSCLAVPIGRPPTQLVLGLSAPTPRLVAQLDEYIATLRKIAAKGAGASRAPRTSPCA